MSKAITEGIRESKFVFAARERQTQLLTLRQYQQTQRD